MEGARYPMDWSRRSWDEDMLAFYSKLGKVRKLPFLAYSAFDAEAIDSEAFAIRRIGKDEAIVAIINRCPRRRTVSADMFMLPSGCVRTVFASSPATIAGGRLSVSLEAGESVLLMLSAKDGSGDLAVI